MILETRKAIEEQDKIVKENKKKKKKFNPMADLPELNPEPDYVVVTRPPMWDEWRLNIFRGLKENRLKMDANKLARRKCWKTGDAYHGCCKNHSKWFGHRHCRTEFMEYLDCCNFEREVELDKMRRDPDKNTEWYWLNIYDEHGEIKK